jgi:hypothetical protein
MNNTIIERITYWQERLTVNKTNISTLNSRLLEPLEDAQELKKLHAKATANVELVTGRLDYWLCRYENDEEEN